MLVGLAVHDDIDVHVVGDGRGGSQHQAGYDRQNRRESHGTDKGQEHVAAEGTRAAAKQLGQQQGRHVATLVNRADQLG